MAVVLVAGGTGFIGSHIVRRLLADGHRVIAMSRSPGRAQGRLPEGVELRRGDTADASTLGTALEGVEVVVAAIQFPNHPVENPRRGHTYVKVDGEGTVRLVEAARRAGVRRFVYMSGAGTREGQTKPWFLAKLMAEKAVRESGIPYTIFRPSWVYGPEDRSLNKFAAFARVLPFVPVIGSGRTRVQPLYVGDLAAAVAASLGTEAAVNQTYEIGGPEELTMDEIIRTMLRVMGRRRPLLHAPAGLVKLAAWPLQILPAPPLSPAAVDFVLMEEPVDNTAVLRDLGIKLTPLAEGLSYLR
ncbi:complex I NDUFA9 subunit family protein [Symbiobacterium terraclitae]|uniref:complex I NDUFA9 subunit family protein n=1 Tax=Symbiobacterium terraclitae TaxID=557451 RepID=UPI0035B527E6